MFRNFCHISWWIKFCLIWSVIFRSCKFSPSSPPSRRRNRIWLIVKSIQNIYILFVEFDPNLDRTYKRLICRRWVRWSEYSAWRSDRPGRCIGLTARRRVSPAAGMSESVGDLSTLDPCTWSPSGFTRRCWFPPSKRTAAETTTTMTAARHERHTRHRGRSLTMDIRTWLKNEWLMAGSTVTGQGNLRRSIDACESLMNSQPRQ